MHRQYGPLTHDWFPLSRMGGVIYFLHMHKSAGTSMCQLAISNGERVQVGYNCNGGPPANPHFCCGETEHEQRSYRATTHFTFVANERLMPSTFLPDLFTYVTILRPPLERYCSHYHHVRSISAEPFPTFGSWFQHQPDNWYVRHICGSACAQYAPVTKRDFDQAWQRLQHFTVAFLDQPRSIAEVCARLHWRNCALVHANRRSRTQSNDICPRTSNRTLWDDALYAAARATVTNLSSQCKTPCCGTCSKFR